MNSNTSPRTCVYIDYEDNIDGYIGTLKRVLTVKNYHPHGKLLMFKQRDNSL